MTNPPAHAPPDESLRWDVLDRWQAGWRAGQDARPEELCPDRPGLWTALRADIAKLKRVPRPDDKPPAEAGWPDIPGYVVTGELGRGGMGVVLAARELRLNRDVAIKLPRGRGAVCRVARARFEREAEVTARLNHPGIPPVYTVGELADGRPYMVMKLVVGQTFADFAECRLTTPADRLHVAIDHFIEFAGTVAVAHRRGVVHRDLKPSNLMIGRYDERLVLDWGLAKRLGRRGGATAADSAWEEQKLTVGAAELDQPPSAGSDELTLGGQVLGTPGYMPPEQARGRTSGARSDVFSLAAVLCEWLTGQPVYGVGRPDELVERAAGGRYSPGFVQALREVRCELAPFPAAIVRCFDRNPDARPDDAGVLKEALLELRLATARVRRSWATS